MRDETPPRQPDSQRAFPNLITDAVCTDAVCTDPRVPHQLRRVYGRLARVAGTERRALIHAGHNAR